VHRMLMVFLSFFLSFISLSFFSHSFFLSFPQVAIEENRVRMSMIFKWYARDFGATVSERLTWIANYLV
jgi:hypothetical protein